MTIQTRDILAHLIRARAALKTDRPADALEAIRKIIKAIDPDRSIEKSMQSGCNGEQRKET